MGRQCVKNAFSAALHTQGTLTGQDFHTTASRRKPRRVFSTADTMWTSPVPHTGFLQPREFHQGPQGGRVEASSPDKQRARSTRQFVGTRSLFLLALAVQPPRVRVARVFLWFCASTRKPPFGWSPTEAAAPSNTNVCQLWQVTVRLISAAPAWAISNHRTDVTPSYVGNVHAGTEDEQMESSMECFSPHSLLARRNVLPNYSRGTQQGSVQALITLMTRIRRRGVSNTNVNIQQSCKTPLSCTEAGFFGTATD